MKKSSAISQLKPIATLTSVLILSSALSCAVAPSSGAESSPEPVASASIRSDALQAAYSSYAKRDFSAAAAGYDSVTGAAGQSAENRRLAYLGKALIHLSTDSEWRNLDEAGSALQSAESIEGGNGDVEASMLINTLSSLIGAEKNNAELSTKVANSSSEIARLKDDRSALEEEQAALNEALEKLKNLTIGN